MGGKRPFDQLVRHPTRAWPLQGSTQPLAVVGDVEAFTRMTERLGIRGWRLGGRHELCERV